MNNSNPFAFALFGGLDSSHVIGREDIDGSQIIKTRSSVLNDIIPKLFAHAPGSYSNVCAMPLLCHNEKPFREEL
jgi:hypothetical protein